MSESTPNGNKPTLPDGESGERQLYILTPVSLGITGLSSVRGLLAVLARRRLLIGGVLLLFLAAGTLHAFLMKPVYQVEVTLAPVTPEGSGGGLAAVAGQFGSLAALAGLPAMNGSSTQEAVAVLQSNALTAEFIRKNDLLSVLFADDWDAKEGRWLLADDEVPSVTDGVRVFNDGIRSVSVHGDTGLVTLHVEWTDPVVAAQWANDLVSLLNRVLRDRETREAAESLEYLRQLLAKSEVVELRATLYKLVEEQEKRLMLASVRDEYAMKVLDPAVPPELDEPIRPRPVAILLVAGVLGLVFGLIAALLRELAAGSDHPGIGER